MPGTRRSADDGNMVPAKSARRPLLMHDLFSRPDSPPTSSSSSSSSEGLCCDCIARVCVRSVYLGGGGM